MRDEPAPAVRDVRDVEAAPGRADGEVAWLVLSDAWPTTWYGWLGLGFVLGGFAMVIVGFFIDRRER
jgi:hypothetical protein